MKAISVESCWVGAKNRSLNLRVQQRRCDHTEAVHDIPVRLVSELRRQRWVWETDNCVDNDKAAYERSS